MASLQELFQVEEYSRFALGQRISFGQSQLFKVQFEFEPEDVSPEDVLQLMQEQELTLRVEDLTVPSSAEIEASISDYYGSDFDTWEASIDSRIEVETHYYSAEDLEL